MQAYGHLLFRRRPSAAFIYRYWPARAGASWARQIPFHDAKLLALTNS
jgi:hypothetical protein